MTAYFGVILDVGTIRELRTRSLSSGIFSSLLIIAEK